MNINLSELEIGQALKTNYDEICFVYEHISASTDWPYVLMFTDGSKHYYNAVGQTLSAQGSIKEVIPIITSMHMRNTLFDDFVYDYDYIFNKISNKRVVEHFVKEMYCNY